VVTELLGQRWSPQQISRHLRHRLPDDSSMRLCHESIYQAVYQPNSRFVRPSRLAPHRRSPLRTGRDHRRAHQCQQRRPPVPAANAHHPRPALPGCRPIRGRALGISMVLSSRLSQGWGCRGPCSVRAQQCP
jgi:IS30 family transposase